METEAEKRGPIRLITLTTREPLARNAFPCSIALLLATTSKLQIKRFLFSICSVFGVSVIFCDANIFDSFSNDEHDEDVRTLEM